MDERYFQLIKVALIGSSIMAVSAYEVFEAGKYSLGCAMITPFFIVGAIITYRRNRDKNK
jgi:hypothetical protein